MADLLPGFEPPESARPRNWHNYADYCLVHERQMTRLIESNVIVSHDVQFFEQLSSLDGSLERVRLKGRIILASGALLDIEKWLDVRDHNGRLEVCAQIYSYHAWIPSEQREEGFPLFRYDNTDDDDLGSLHRHRYYTDGTQRERTEEVPHEQLPYLDAIIEEAERIGASHPHRPLNRPR